MPKNDNHRRHVPVSATRSIDDFVADTMEIIEAIDADLDAVELLRPADFKERGWTFVDIRYAIEHTKESVKQRAKVSADARLTALVEECEAMEKRWLDAGDAVIRYLWNPRS